jgi:hypothetical protein
MDILISFSTSVGVVEALKIVKDVAVDVVNQSIVMWLRNKKIPNPGQPDRPFNNRELNSKPLPPGYRTGKYLYLTRTVTEYYYAYRNTGVWIFEEERSTESGYRVQEIYLGVVVRSENSPATGARIEPAGRFDISFIPPPTTLNYSSYTTDVPFSRIDINWNLSIYSASFGD